MHRIATATTNFITTNCHRINACLHPSLMSRTHCAQPPLCPSCPWRKLRDRAVQADATAGRKPIRAATAIADSKLLPFWQQLQKALEHTIFMIIIVVAWLQHIGSPARALGHCCCYPPGCCYPPALSVSQNVYRLGIFEDDLIKRKTADNR